MSRLFVFLIIVCLFLGVDYYVYQALKILPDGFRRPAQIISLTLSIGSVLAILAFVLMPGVHSSTVRNFMMTLVLTNLLVKLFAGLFILLDDFIRLGRWVAEKLSPASPTPDTGSTTIPRSEFLVKTAALAGSIPLVGVGYGILVGAHDYRIRRVSLTLPNLPRAFDGLTIAQISDIHSGSFFNKRAVQGGVDLLLAQKPDVVFFTGDLVNNEAPEVIDYIPIFQKIKAPLGVYSVLGNHDYGDYVAWASQEAKARNLTDLKHAHSLLGWDLLLDQNRKLIVDGDELGIIGIENWGAGGFAKYGNLAKAYQGIEDMPVKLLLSHDPSHWEAQVRTQFPDIDVMFAGHTHGMQFGVEVGNVKWSPVKYLYKQWAGLYQQPTKNGQMQSLYVNRGFGYLGFPGRLGMPPEITVFELKRQA